MKARGFTLIEMVLTMVVSGILVLGIAGFIELGMKGYADSVDRQRVQTQAKFVLEKMSREIRHAVPNVFTEDGNCISFYPVIDSGFYAVSGADINFIVGGLNTTSNALSSMTLLINPTQTLATGGHLSSLINSFSLSSMVKLDNDEVSGATFSIPSEAVNLIGGSVVNRLYITDPNRQISYCVIEGRVERGEGNGSLPLDTQPLTDRLSVNVSGSVSYQPANVQKNGIVDIDLTFSQNDESTHFQQDIQVLNVP